MKICICTTPIRPDPTDFPPLGSLAIIQSLRKIGIEAFFFNIDFLRPSAEEIKAYFSLHQFDVVGISAVVSTAYSYTKWLSSIIRESRNSTTIISGGNLSASAEILLRKTDIDVCVVGDGEFIILDLIRKIQGHHDEQKKYLDEVKGICYLNEQNDFKFTGYGAKPDASEIEHPDYSILAKDGSIAHYLPSIEPEHDENNSALDTTPRRSATVIATKGCVARCTFCHRWEKGYRARPLENLKHHIHHLINDYGVTDITFGDENFGADKELTRGLALEMGKLKLSWIAAGVRARTVNLEDLQLWKENGCKAIYFGIESGSQKILDIMEKKATVQENINALKWTAEADLDTIIQLVIGMPGEDDLTINETIDFLKNISKGIKGWHESPPSGSISINYAQALPGTPLYEFARENNFIGKSIDLEENYLIQISDTDAYSEDHFINYTGLPTLKILAWRPLILAKLDAHHYIHNLNNEELPLYKVFGYYLGILLAKLNIKLLQRNPSSLEGSDKNYRPGYFNIQNHLMLAPLLLNKYTKLAFTPLLLVIVAMWRGKSASRALGLMIEFLLWKVGITNSKLVAVPNKSLRKVIKIQSIGENEGDENAKQMLPLRLGR